MFGFKFVCGGSCGGGDSHGVSDDTAADATQRQVKKLRGPLADHPKMRLTVQLAALVTFVLATLYLTYPNLFPPKPSGSATATSASTSMPPASESASSSPQSTQSALPSTPVVDLGSCLSASYTLLDCRQEHVFEVVARSQEPCTPDSMARYLGGLPGVDVYVVQPQRLPSGPAANACAVTIPMGVSTTSSNRAAATPNKLSAAWRRCTNARTANDRVSCSLPHTGEYIGLAPNSTDCALALFLYTGASFDQVSAFLAISRVLPSGVTMQACLASVLGNNVLDKSIFGLGTQTLPISPG